MKVDLLNIPGINPEHESKTKIRALSIDERSEVINELKDWAQSEPSDFKKIMNAMRVAAGTRRGDPISPKHVKKSANSAHGNAYEFRADKGKVRIMFFYLEDIIICTNTFRKQKDTDKQDTAFVKCTRIRDLCLPNLPCLP